MGGVSGMETRNPNKERGKFYSQPNLRGDGTGLQMTDEVSRVELRLCFALLINYLEGLDFFAIMKVVAHQFQHRIRL